MPPPPPVLNAVLLLVVAGLAAGCGGSPDPAPGSFDEAKRQLAEIVKRTAQAALPDLRGKPSSGPPVPCRTLGGSGPASGEFLPDYGLEFKLSPDADGRAMVERVAAHWREEGYANVRTELEGDLVSVFASGDGRNLAFEADAKYSRADLGASGPCLKPDSEADIGPGSGTSGEEVE